MKLKKLGKNTSKKAEVLSISPFGIWILVYNEEYFLPYDNFPWFKEASVKNILDLKLEHKSNLRWEALDIDLELESLKNLEKYPLLAQ